MNMLEQAVAAGKDLGYHFFIVYAHDKHNLKLAFDARDPVACWLRISHKHPDLVLDSVQPVSSDALARATALRYRVQRRAAMKRLGLEES